MATNLKVSVDVDTGNLKQGMGEATQSMETFEREIQEINAGELPKLQKEMRKAKQTALNLGLEYSKLSDELKNSKHGQELKRQFDEAVQSAAELLDLQLDINEKIKNLSSDTLALDIVADGFDVVANSVTGVLGAIGTATGTTEDMNRAMSALAASQGLVSAATKIQNMLQPQSNLLIGIGALQSKAKAKADELAAAATGKATLAQRAFNAVAKANPYVLLAVGVATLVAAIGTYIALTHKSAEEERAAQQAAEQRAEGAKALADSLEETIPKYTRLQHEWKNLRSEGEKKQWIEDNKTEFKNLGVEINNTGDAENFLVTNTSLVKQAFIARAKAAMQAAEAAQIYRQEMELVNKAESGKAVTMDEALSMGLDRADVNKNAKYNHGWFGNDTFELTDAQITKARENAMKKAEKRMGKLYDDMSKSEKEEADKFAEAGVKAWREANNKKNKAIGKNDNSSKTQLQKLEDEVSKYKKALENVNVDAPNADNIIANIKENIKQAEKAVKDYKIKIGIEADTQEGSIDYFNNKISELEKKQHSLKINSPEWKELQSEIDTWTAAKHEAVINTYVEGSLPYYDERIKALKDEQIKLKINSPEWKELQSDIDAITKEKKDVEIQANYEEFEAELNKSVEEALTVKTPPKYDFSLLPQSVQDDAERLQTQAQQIESEMERLQDLMGDKKATTTQIDLWTEAYKRLAAQLGLTTEQLAKYQAQNTANKAKEDNAKKTAETFQYLGGYISNVSSALSSLGDAYDDIGSKQAAIVAQAIATLTLSFAQVMMTSKTVWDWIAFGTAGVATLAGMVSQMKSIQGYATGGVVGGHSYQGDKLLARVNSGETIMTEKQAARTNAMLDAKDTGVQTIHVVGKIQGKDLLLVQRNANKVMHKSGQSINI